MAATICVVCSTGFSARSDAVYCSSACRQKAHRARVARRVAALSSQNSDHTRPVGSRGVRADVARTLERAREQIAQSRKLCDVSAERLRLTAALQWEFDSGQEVRATTPMPYGKWPR